LETQVDKIYYDKDGIIVRRSIKEDVYYLSDKLRDSDVNEIWACSNRLPLESLKRSLETSIFCCTIINKEPIGIFGISPLTVLADKASVWFLGTNGIDKIQRRFAKNSKYFINMMLEFYPYLYNWVDDRNTVSIKWLKLCGAVIEEPKPHGKEKLPFRYFYFQKGGNNV
jgi:hypothetical protein